MRIPTEATSPYLSEIANRPLADNKRAEPVGDSARMNNTLSQAPLDQQTASMETAQEAIQERARGEGSERVVTEERRKGDRRKEQRFVFLDTRASKSRRKSNRAASINFKV